MLPNLLYAKYEVRAREMRATSSFDVRVEGLGTPWEGDCAGVVGVAGALRDEGGFSEGVRLRR